MLQSYSFYHIQCLSKVIIIISSRRHLPICYILCCSDTILCSHIGYILCGSNLCSISAISIICVHFKVFKCGPMRGRHILLCLICMSVCVTVCSVCDNMYD